MVMAACQKNKDKVRYLITEDQVGNLNKETQIHELKTVFPDDSIVNRNNSSDFSNRNEIVIYSKEDQRELLRLHPKVNFDSTSTIGTVQVMDTIFRTEKGLARGVDFEVLHKNYTIERIENTLGTAMLFLKGSNIYVDIDKREIAEPVQMGVKIQPSQIKRKAKIKHLWIAWD